MHTMTAMRTMGRLGRRLPVAVVITAVLAALALVQPGPPAAESNGGVRVMPLGDSITDGFNVPGGYRIDLWQRLGRGGGTPDLVRPGGHRPPGARRPPHPGPPGLADRPPPPANTDL